MLLQTRSRRKKTVRNRSARYRAKKAAHNRRRINGMKRRRLSAS